jgi:hypothetical protein
MSFVSDGDFFCQDVRYHCPRADIIDYAVRVGTLEPERRMLAKLSMNYFEKVAQVRHSNEASQIVLALLLCLNHFKEVYNIPLRLVVDFIGGESLVSSVRPHFDKSVNPAETLEELCKEPT